MAAIDAYEFLAPALATPSTNGEAVTPNDSADLSYVSRGLWVGGAGNLAVILKGMQTPVTLVGVAAGSLLPLRVSRVMSTNTTATNIVSLW